VAISHDESKSSVDGFLVRPQTIQLRTILDIFFRGFESVAVEVSDTSGNIIVEAVVVDIYLGYSLP
jgi:hypothetical protein